MAQEDSIGMTDIYRFLARSMRYPDAAWMDDQYFAIISNILNGLGWDDESRDLADFLDFSADWLEPIQIEYTRLFVNAVPSVIAPPYGSIYLSADGMLYGPSAVSVKEFYQEKGFELAGEGDLPDHISSELEFLALLAEQGNQADEDLFLNKHFRTWFPKFKEKLLGEVQHPFYRILVKLIDFFTREE
ncbi:MAG: molecular chaperone TorD family protein [Desulfobulbaceae bacterium]|nr:molecular chaperone TorD family protein [Desulfobulbaceae bacterium]HIJ79273.1 hypothetical protein [Deltaproteobacteria bacterium]